MDKQFEQGYEIAGTQVFGLRQSHDGYRINKLCSSLTRADNRAAYEKDEAAYLDRYALTPQEKELILRRDFTGLLEAGGNIFFLIKLGNVTGYPIYQIGAQMRGESYEDFLATRQQSGAV